MDPAVRYSQLLRDFDKARESAAKAKQNADKQAQADSNKRLREVNNTIFITCDVTIKCFRRP